MTAETARGGPRRRLRHAADAMGAMVDRMPLRVRLVSALMVLVMLGLFLISAASVVFMRSYLINRVDSQLQDFRAQILRQTAVGNDIELSHLIPVNSGSAVQLKNVYFFQLRNPDGHVTQYPVRPDDYPRVPTDHASLVRLSAAGHSPFTVDGTAGAQWRVLVQSFPDSDQFLIIAATFRDVTGPLNNLIRVDVLVGMVVMLVLAVVGAGVVASSLRPLHDIERTAGAIATGNLALRVPERDPGTELGRLGRALNAMLGQIEAAFEAQASSEHAAVQSANSARRAANAARESAAAAHRSEGKMRRFIADASHELRTPLTTIRGFAELYRQKPDKSAAEADRLMARIEAEASRMGLLVEDLLLLARMDQQRPIAREPVDLLAIAADTVQAAGTLAPDRDISLRAGGGSPDAEPPVVLGDEPRLRQVVRNLMDNALAHTPAGTPVEIRVRTEDHAAVIEVVDAGPGLTQEQKERVFERFYRVDKARSREAGGTGLGLAIVASLVAAHHGTVSVDSSPGTGATFQVRLPLATDDEPEPAGAGTDRPAPPAADAQWARPPSPPRQLGLPADQPPAPGGNGAGANHAGANRSGGGTASGPVIDLGELRGSHG